MEEKCWLSPEGHRKFLASPSVGYFRAGGSAAAWVIAATAGGTGPTEEICTSKLVGIASLGTGTVSVSTDAAAFAMKLLE